MFVLLGISLISIGCGDDNGTGPGDGTGLDPITFPLAVGNSWVYEAVTETTQVVAAQMDTLRVVGTQDVDGSTYYLLRDTGEGEGEETLVRQEGQDVLVIPPIEEPLGGDPLDEWLSRVLEESAPWKFADLDAPSGANWTIIDADTSIDLGGKTETIRLSFVGSSLGHVSVSVPAGSYSDVYAGEIGGTLTLGTQVMQLTDQTLWIADGVGLVKETNSWVEMEGGPTITETSELTSFQLE
jgi:hypothetical protein